MGRWLGGVGVDKRRGGEGGGGRGGEVVERGVGRWGGMRRW